MFAQKCIGKNTQRFLQKLKESVLKTKCTRDKSLLLPEKKRDKKTCTPKKLSTTSFIDNALFLATASASISFTGGISGFVGAVHKPSLNKLNFAFMFLAYLTIFKLGQTFMWFQWDTLMLEVGALAVLVAPFRGKAWFIPRHSGAHLNLADFFYLVLFYGFSNFRS